MVLYVIDWIALFRGVGAMEIVAMDMKLRGMYIARQLSFHGVAFKIEEVPLSNDFVSIYDDAVSLVSLFSWLLLRFLNSMYRNLR